MANTTLNPCSTFYFVDLDAHGRPIVDTMFARNNNKIPTAYRCNEARLTGANMPVPAGYTHCRNSLRYWYQVKMVPNGTGITGTTIVPNSMIQRIGRPNSASNGFCWVEYSVFKKNS